MTSQQLISRLQTLPNKEQLLIISRELVDAKFSVRKLIDFAFYKQPSMGFRAVWALENMVLMDINLLKNELDYFLQKYPEVNNRSVRRHFSKMLIWLINEADRDDRFGQKFWSHDLEPVLTACFDWLIDTQEKVAVKVQVMDCIFLLSKKYPWALEELLPTVEYLQADATPGMKLRAKWLMEKVQRL